MTPASHLGRQMGSKCRTRVGNDAAREMLKPKRGWPASAKPKEHVNIRLDADVVGAFKDSRAGWQTHINNALREWLKAPSEIPKG